jgi:DnaK suppressor protein
LRRQTRPAQAILPGIGIACREVKICEGDRAMIKTINQPEAVTKQSLIWKDMSERLEKERRQIADRAGRLAMEMEGGWQERDSPSEIEIREVEFNHREALQTRLRDIDEALARISYQTYGLCIDCKKRIPLSRLFNDPTVCRCLGCQAAADGEVPENRL